MGKWQSMLMLLALGSLLFTATSCERIYDDELDCSTKIKFVFKKHRQALQSVNGKIINAFETVVGTVHVFVYDAESGELVFEQFEKVDRLKTESELNMGTGSDRCYLPVDLAPGKYRLVVWCGLDGTDENNAFSLTNGNSLSGYAECNVKRSVQTGQPVHQEKYESLYHGAVEMVTVNSDGTTVIPVELTKNTNDIAVWVQHTSMTFAPGDYEVVYTDANGTLKFEDNTLLPGDRLEYYPHTTSLLTSSTEYNGSVVEAGALIAHISTSRLMESSKKDARLEVRNRQGEIVFSIPFIQYVLEMQTFVSDGQYYLDCEDTYNCSFYLTGESGTWMPACIIINSWVKVPEQNSTI